MEKMLEVVDRSETYLVSLRDGVTWTWSLRFIAVHDMMAETWGEVQETAGKEATERGGLDGD